jgi:hemolysin-activating ACP:hemolysin acyltransferase
MFGSKRKSADPAADLPALKPASLNSSSGEAVAPNGAAPSAPGIQPTDDAQRRTAIALRRSAAFAQIVTVLMRAPLHKHLALSDLEWLVFPPLLTGQFSVAEVKSKDGKTRFPAAVVLWASVSADVDKRLSENLNAPIRLRPDEWRSGEILWLVEAIGDARVVHGLLKQLAGSVFKDREVKVRARDGGRLVLKTLRQMLEERESKQ